MDKQTTHVAIILDRSGSMWRTKAATVRGYNEQVQQIKEDAKDENHDIFVSLVTFNGSVTEHLWSVPAEQLEEASEKDFKPTGSTAMRDAMGHTIQKLLDTTNSDDKNTAYLVCVISDGEENASKYFNVSALRELTESVQNSNRWTINYMGCDESYLKKIAKETSVPVANCAVWTNDSVQNTEAAMKEMGGKLGGYFKGRASGQMASKAFHNTSGLEACDNYVGSVNNVNEPAANAAVFQPVNVQDVFNNAMKYSDVSDVVQPIKPVESVDQMPIKPCANVFGTGNMVDWSEFVS